MGKKIGGTRRDDMQNRETVKHTNVKHDDAK